jgi:Trm5-related predicted tRNA methylase
MIEKRIGEELEMSDKINRYRITLRGSASVANCS